MTPVERLRAGLRHQVFVLEHELLARFHVVGIVRDALDRTYLDTLRIVEVADALRAQVRVDHVVLLAQRDGLVRAHGLADVAVDAGIEDKQGHGPILPYLRPPGRPQRKPCLIGADLDGNRAWWEPTLS